MSFICRKTHEFVGAHADASVTLDYPDSVCHAYLPNVEENLLELRGILQCSGEDGESLTRRQYSKANSAAARHSAGDPDRRSRPNAAATPLAPSSKAAPPSQALAEATTPLRFPLWG